MRRWNSSSAQSPNAQMKEKPAGHFELTAREYQQGEGSKVHALLPYKEGIAELRSKRASFETIAVHLGASGMSVSSDTVARFCHQYLTSKQAAPPAIHADLLPSNLPDVAPSSFPPSRKGPRIADPRNI